MKKLPLCIVFLAAVVAPAFATHPVDECNITLDLGAIVNAIESASPVAASAAQGLPIRVKVRYLFATNMTDMYPLEPQILEKPAEGPWIFSDRVRTDPEARTLTEVRVESPRYNPETGNPLWTYSYRRQSSVMKDNVFDCSQFAD